MLDRYSPLSAWRDYARFGISAMYRDDRQGTWGIVRVDSLRHTYPNGAIGVANMCYVGGEHITTIFDGESRDR